MGGTSSKGGRRRFSFAVGASDEEVARHVRETLERYGEDNEAIRSLSADDRIRLENEFFELQKRYELELERLLDEEQLDAYLETDPVIIRFRYGGGSAGSHKSGVF